MFSELVSFLFSLQSFLLVIILIVTLYAISCLLFPDVPVSDLEKKAVLITGCDSGFGYELAKKLDSRGLQVFAGCLTSDGQAKLRSECSTRMTTLELDVVNQSDIQKAFEVVKSLLSSNGTNGTFHNFHLPPFNRTKQLLTELQRQWICQLFQNSAVRLCSDHKALRDLCICVGSGNKYFAPLGTKLSQED